MKPRYKSDIPSAIVVVRCGTRQGTAFYISENRLMTARHNLVENINNKAQEEIWIEREGKRYLCELTDFGKDEKVDVSVIQCCDSQGGSECFIKLLSLPYKQGDCLFVEGFPKELGLSGHPLHFEVESVKDVSDREYDVITSPVRPTEICSYKGLSGAPILNVAGSAVGVITDQLNKVLGYKSIEKLTPLLNKVSINYTSEWEEEDYGEYGRGTAKDLLQKRLKLAGERYSKDWHQPDENLEGFLEQFSGKTYIDEQYSQLKEIEDDYLNLRDNYVKPDGQRLTYLTPSEDEINNGASLYVKGRYSEMSYYLDRALVEADKHGEEGWCIKLLKYDLEVCKQANWNLLDTSKQFLLVQGKAGFGKTHRLCYFADKHKSKCNVYLLFGGQIDNGGHGIVKQVCALCGFEEQDLSGLDDYMRSVDRYAVIIVDAINEGAGVSFWKDNLPQLIEEIESRKNIKLILSVRDPFRLEEFYDGDSTLFAIKQAQGFVNPISAAEHYLGTKEIKKDFIRPFLPDLKSPLFLKIFCSSVKKIPYYHRNQINKIWLYLIYIEDKDAKVCEKVDEDPELKVSEKYLTKLSNYSIFNNYCNDVQKHIARRYGDAICRGRFWKQSLLRVCLEENLLVEHYPLHSEPVIGFDYEEMGDFLRAYSLYLSKMDAEGIVNWMISQDGYLQRHNLDKRRFGNLIGAFLSIKDAKSEILRFPAFQSGTLSKYLIYALQYKNGARNTEALQLLIKSGSSDFVEYLIEGFGEYGLDAVNALNECLMPLSLAERDLLWTHKVNQVYDLYGFEYFWDGRIEIQTEDDIEKASYIMTWMLCSSYPEARAILVRKLVELFEQRPGVISELLDQFYKCNDDYVVEGLLCAIYGYLLRPQNRCLLSLLAEKVYQCFYANGNDVPQNLLIRQWSLKIMELDSRLNDSAFFDKSNPPYNIAEEPYADYNAEEDIYSDKEYFGSSNGSDLLHESLTGFSDFNRYVIGTNTSLVSRVFLDKKTHMPVSLSVIENLVCHKVKSLGWNDGLGELDNGKYSHSRHDNKRERIGKKYQWISFYRVIGQLTDWCDMKNWFSDDGKIKEINYPWYSEEQSRFDPSLQHVSSGTVGIPIRPIAELEMDGTPPLDWIENDSLIPTPNVHFLDDDKKEWILLMGYDSLEENTEDITKEYFMYYNSAFVKRENVEELEDWAMKQNFYGRWMPERTGSCDFLWNEYPWSDSFKNYLGNEEWSEFLHNDCPTKIMLSYMAQLQENTMGFDDSYGFSSTIYMPCRDMMDKLGLFTAERGVVRSLADKSIVAINAELAGHNRSGILVLKHALDQYLDITGYALFYFTLGEKMLSYKATSIPGKIMDLSMCQKYERGVMTDVQPLHVVRPTANVYEEKSQNEIKRLVDKLLRKNKEEGLTNREMMTLTKLQKKLKESDEQEHIENRT